MRSLDARLTRLEHQLGGRCASCKKRPARVELRGPANRAAALATVADACPDCGHVPELITVLVAFDPEPAVPYPARDGTR
jgi:hypothetical protein